jgi:hypothetical protein
MKMVVILPDQHHFKGIRIVNEKVHPNLYEKLTQPVPKTYPSLRRF